MRVIVNTPGEQIPVVLKGLVSTIQRKHGDCEAWLKGYNKCPYNFTWYGYGDDKPRVEKEIESISIGKPCKGWCPDEFLDKEFFVIKLK